MNLKQALLLPLILLFIAACQDKPKKDTTVADNRKKDSLAQIEKAKEAEKMRDLSAADITLNTDLAYEQHTLEETYPYKDTTREFQMDKIKGQ